MTRPLMLLWTLLTVRALAAPTVGTVTVQITPRPAATFRPSVAFGAGVDGLEQGDVAKVYTPANLRAMRRVGYGPLTYRLRTELGIEAWHWNPQGHWSEGPKRQGYWTSDAGTGNPILNCNGYRLPRRGSTIDQAGNDGYSRLDDGDARSFWKSNPYLDRRFTGEDNSLLPQWVVVDLGRRRLVNSIRLQWATPFATHYRVEYWQGRNDPDDGLDQTEEADTAWRVFPQGGVRAGAGGDVYLRLTASPLPVRFVRLWLMGSSGTAPTGSRDLRDSLGYALREIGVGETRAGRFQDWVRHAARRDGQTAIYVSSTDPWHRATDRDANVEQPGFDRGYRSGLTHGLPVLMSTGLLYDTPDNAAAELRRLRARGYSIRGVELGEEPDGQYMSPEDYGALYVQWATALRRVDAHVPLGGPSFQTNIYSWTTWPNAEGDRSWIRRFLRYLRYRGHLADFQFFSFEWYPFDNVCGPTTSQLAWEPALLENALARLHHEGLPTGLPTFISEYGYSAFAGQPEMDLAGALLNADIVGQFLTLGGVTAYLYGLEPNSPMKEAECNSWGNLAVFLSDDDRHIKFTLPTYYAARLLTNEWAQASGDEVHQVYRVTSDVSNARGQALVTAYAVHRPDGQWSVLLVNKDPRVSHTVRLRFRDAHNGTVSVLMGPVTLVQYGPAQYRWQAHGEQSHPTRDEPPTVRRINARTIILPPYSLSVVRGRKKT